MITAISTYSIIDANNRFYTACNIISTIALFALKEAACLSFNAFTLLGITTLVANYSIFNAIATPSLKDRKKFISLQITLLAFIVLGSAVTNVIFISPALFLSKFLFGLLSGNISFCIADLPLYMLLLSIICSPLHTFSQGIYVLRKNLAIHNKLLQQLRLTNGSFYQKSLDQVTSSQCFNFIGSFIFEAINGELWDEINTDQNTIIFERSPILAPYLIIRVNQSTQLTLQEYQNNHGPVTTNHIDATIAKGVSFIKEILQFAKKKPHLQTVSELNDIMSRYNSLQNSLRKRLTYQFENTNDRKRVTSLINSLYLSYQKNIIPIRFRFPDNTSNDDMEQPAWNYLAIKFPRDFFTNLPSYLFTNRENPDKLDQDFKKYHLSTAGEFLTKIFDGKIAAFRASSKEQVIKKLIHHCTNNSPSHRYKIEFLKIRDQAYKIIKISTAIFSSIVAPLLVHPIEFSIGSLYAVISKRTTSQVSVDTISTSLFEGFFLSKSSLGSLWAGCQFTSRYIVPLLA